MQQCSIKKKGKHLSQKTRKEKTWETWETWVCPSSLKLGRQEVLRLRADLLRNDVLNQYHQYKFLPAQKYVY